MLDEEAERVRRWLAVVRDRQRIGEPDLDAAITTGEATIAGLTDLAMAWREEATRSS